jgi:hypothetical protein
MDLPARAFSSVVRRVLRFQLPSRKSPRTKPTLWSVELSARSQGREPSVLLRHCLMRRI